MYRIKELDESYGVWKSGKLHAMPERIEDRYRWAIIKFSNNTFGTKVFFKIQFMRCKEKVEEVRMVIGTGISSYFGGLAEVERMIKEICSDGNEWKVGKPLKWATLEAVAKIMCHQNQ